MKKNRLLTILMVLALLLSSMPVLSLNATAKPAAPNPVHNLTASPAGKNRVRLKWDFPTEQVDGYLIYAQKNGVYGYVGQADWRCWFVDENALADAANYYWVFPYRNDGEGGKVVGNCSKFVYARGICPAVGLNLAESVEGGVKLKWSSSSGAEGYLIYGIRPGGAYGYIGMTTKGTTFTDKKASTDDWTYYWVFPYFKDETGKIIPGKVSRYVWGKAE